MKEKFGLNDLISIIMNKIKNSIESMSFVYVINYIKKNIRENILNTDIPFKTIMNYNIINSIIEYIIN